MKPIALLALSLACGVLTAGATETVIQWTSGQTIPDDDSTGLADTRTVSSPFASITSVEVKVQLSGGWNGDLHAWLSHDTGYSVLLNCPGRTAFSDAGASDAGMRVTFSDDAVTDAHAATGLALLTGSLQPDARETDPLEVLDSSPRTAFLSSFQGLDPNGEWTLFLVDASGGNVSTLVSWGLTIRGTGTSPQVLFNAWAAGLSGPDAQALATPFHDGVNNLTKYAFNLNPLGSDVRQLIFGTGGTAGLPDYRITESATTVTLEVEYLRNTVSGLLYTPQYSTTLDPGTFIPMTGPVTVTPIDACWERIVASQLLDRATTLRGFARVAVQLP